MQAYFHSSFKKYRTVAALAWQDSMVYRFNALVWVLYAVLPAATLMLVWLAAYRSGNKTEVGGFDLPEMMTYYLLVTALAVVITPHPEWEMAQQIRDGKITGFITRPIGYYGYRLVQETSYQMVKTVMFLPTLLVMLWFFRSYLRLPPFDAGRMGLFLLSTLLAYALITQIKFLLGISAFWIAEVSGFLEIWNTMMAVFGGRLLPLNLMPDWLQWLGNLLPIELLYSFPMQILMNRITTEELWWGFVRQLLWLGVLSLLVRWMWRRGLVAYEAYGG